MTVIVLASGLFGRTGDVFASRMLSPSEISLMEFQKERDELMKNRSAEKNPRILKNKLTILENKITYLQNRIKRVKPHVVEQRLVPADTASNQTTTPQPVAVQWRDRAGQEAPGRPMMAWTPNAAELKPRAASAARISASPEASFKPAAQPQTRLAPSKAPVALPVLPQRAAAVEHRAEASTRTPALKVDLQPTAPVSARAVSQAEAVPVKPLLGATPSVREDAGEAESKIRAAKTGADWKEMTPEDKEIYILSAMGNLSRRDVYLMKPYNFYIEAIDRALEKDRRLEKEFIHRILMMRAYDSEPDARKDLEKIWK
jgi:hypothetical protein